MQDNGQPGGPAQAHGGAATGGSGDNIYVLVD